MSLEDVKKAYNKTFGNTASQSFSDTKKSYFNNNFKTSGKADALLKTISTTYDLANTAKQGLGDWTEGILDLGTQAVAAVTKPFLPEVSKSIQAFGERDLTEEGINLNAGLLGIIGSAVANKIAEGDGKYADAINYEKDTEDMLEDNSAADEIAIPLSKINENLSDISLKDVTYQVANQIPSMLLGQGLGQAASLGTMAASAAGQSTNEALADGAGIGSALGYGLASGAVEAGTELMFDPFGTYGGNGVLDKILPAKTIIGKLAVNALGEAAEEAVSAAVNPALKTIYNKDAITETTAKEYFSDIANSAIAGGVTSFALAPFGSGNNVSESVDTVNELESRKETLERKGKLTEEKATKINQDIADANNTISKALQKMTEEKRAQAIQTFKLSDTFNEDGTLKETATYERGKYSTVGTETADVKKIASDSGFTLAEELNEGQTNSWNKIREYTQKLKKKGLNIKGVAVVNETNTNSDFTVAGENKNGIILVNANRLSNLESALETLTHESTHSLPVTTETMKVIMASVLSEDAAIRESKSTKAVHEVLENYGYTIEEFQEAAEMFYQGADINDREANLLEEVTAVYSEQLGNEDSLNRITRADGNLILQAYYAVHDAVELHRISGDTAKAEYKQLRAYEKLYADALQSNGYDINVSDDDEEAKESRKKKEAYTLSECREIVDKLIDGMSNETQTISVTKTARANAAKKLYNTINSTKENRAGLVAQIADEIIDKADVWENDEVDYENDYIRSGEYEDDLAELATLKSYIHNIKTDNIKADVKSVFDNKTRGILSRWGARADSKNPVSADQVMHDHKNLHLQPETDTAQDILVAMNSRYEELLAKTEKVRPYAMTFTNDEVRNSYRNQVTNYVLNQVDQLGDRSEDVGEQYNEEVAKMMAEKETAEKIADAEGRAAYAKDELAEMKNNLSSITRKAQGTANWIHKVTMQADELKALTNRKWAQMHGYAISANMMNNDQFKSLAKKVSQLFRGDLLDPRKVRTQISSVAEWFTADNELFKDYLDEIYSSNPEIMQAQMDAFEDAFDALKEKYDAAKDQWSNEPLTMEELQGVSKILAFVNKLYTQYDQIFENGKRQNVTELCKEYDAKLEIAKYSAGGKRNLFQKYNSLFTSPISVAQHLDGYTDGFFTHYVEQFRKDTWEMNAHIMELNEELDAFVKRHKHLGRQMTKEFVKINGKEIKVGEFLDAYLMATQDNGMRTIHEQGGGGFTYTDKHGIRSKKGIVCTESDFRSAYNSLDDSVKEFGEIIRKAYQEGGKLKAATDQMILGFTDVKGDGKYYQLVRDREFFKSSTGDASKASADMQSVFNLKENKKRSEKAKKIPLQAQDVYAKFQTYAKHTAMYAAFANDIGNFRRIYNKQLVPNESIKIKADELWSGIDANSGSDKYWKKYLDDIQGVKNGESLAAFGKMRSAYAQAQLGMNIKVIAGQFCSYPTAFCYLTMSDLSKGLVTKTDYEAMDKYSKLARTRNYEGSAFKAETLSDTVNTIGKAGSFMIGRADRFTIGKIWNASVHHFEGKYSGTELYEHAAELFDKVVSETQPTYQASDRSLFQRSNNEIVKSLSMFTSVPMKQISELVSSVDRVHALNMQKKAGVNITEEQLKTAKGKMAKTITAIVAANAMYAAMCQLVKLIYDKDDEEDNDGRNIAEQLAMQFLETNVSMFPGFKELYGFVVNDYDMLDVSSFSAVNDLADAIKSVFSIDSTEDALKATRDVSMRLLMLAGIPARNTYNMIYGFTNRINKPAAVTWDSYFTEKKSYGSAISKAVENGDEDMINTYLTIQSGTDGLPKVYNQLIAKGYTDILPRSVGTTFTYDGETIEMTKKERKNFQATYSGYQEIVSNMARTVVFKTATDEVKAKAIKAIQNTYWQMAIDDTMGEETTAKLYVFSKAINMAKLAVITEQCKSYSADKDDDGNSISGSKKTKIQKYLKQTDLTAAQQALVLAYLGYTDKSSKAQVKAYINSLNITKAEKEAMFEMCGY